MALVWNGRAQRPLGSLPEAKDDFLRAIEVASALHERPLAVEEGNGADRPRRARL